ncbi:MAG: ADP compounds hydrolase NudE [Gammaproteobacteria bacterium]|nr:ADP compounds hydrolase NudE [Gammaproteobacteria bacterium]
MVSNKPKILNQAIVAQSRLFRIEQVDLRFSNGVETHYERMLGSTQGAVLIVPILNESTLLMIKEYCVGVERYELTLPKGKIDSGESILDAANRELQEEVGYAAGKLTHLKSISLAPGYSTQFTHIVVAEELYPCESVDGDEPEPLEVVSLDLEQLNEIVVQEECTEGRTIAALYLTREFLNGNVEAQS